MSSHINLYQPYLRSCPPLNWCQTPENPEEMSGRIFSYLLTDTAAETEDFSKTRELMWKYVDVCTSQENPESRMTCINKTFKMLYIAFHVRHMIGSRDFIDLTMHLAKLECKKALEAMTFFLQDTPKWFVPRLADDHIKPHSIQLFHHLKELLSSEVAQQAILPVLEESEHAELRDLVKEL